jgi:hypothetical protein
MMVDGLALDVSGTDENRILSGVVSTLLYF